MRITEFLRFSHSQTECPYYDLEAAARRLGQDPDALPLIAVCDGAGRAVYSVSGYQVGSVQLIAHALTFLSQKS